MPKNIIICCDGTGNQFGDRNSNVVKLYSVIRKTPDRQIAYYDPGLGTTSYSGMGFSLGTRAKRMAGLAIGAGLYQNVFEAYAYLMEHYAPGDRVFLFGFSRGAYTVRVLSGFIHMLGLLEQGCQNLVPYAFEIYARKQADFETAGRFKSRFSRPCPIEFLGLWDTVSSVGFVWNLKSYPFTANNKNVKTIRHALAIDERRAFYSQNKLGRKVPREEVDIKEVWFAGVHSDVGGSYPEAESGLAKLPLQWMLNEAAGYGLDVDPKAYSRRVLGKDSGPLIGPNPYAEAHRSLTGVWHLMEIVPWARVDYAENTKKWFLPLGRRRLIPEGAYVHESVVQRMAKLDYRPANLPRDYRVEKQVENIDGN